MATVHDLSKLPIDLLYENIEVRKQQLESLGVTHPDYAYLLSDMSAFWIAIFKRSGKQSDLDNAIGVAREAYHLMHEDDPDPAFVFGQLSAVLSKKFFATGRKEDLDETLEFSNRAVEAAKPSTAQWMHLRLNHNFYLIETFKHFGNLEHLDEIIESSRALIELKTKVDCGLPVAKLYSNYSACLSIRAVARSSLDDLDDGISAGYTALDSCSQEDPDYFEVINDLIVRVLHRYENTQTFDSLKEAIRLSEKAIDTQSKLHLHRPVTLITHSVLLFHLSERVRNSDPLRSLRSLDEAISVIKEALETNVESDEWTKYAKVTALDNLSAWLGLRLKLAHDLSAGKEAVEIADMALEEVTLGYREKSTLLNNLAVTLERLFEELKTSDPVQARKYLERGIQIATSAVDESDKADYRYAERVITLAALRAKLYLQTENDDEFEEVRKLWLSASRCPSARPIVRISAGLKAGHANFADSQYDLAHEVLTSAIELLPKINTRSIPTADQQHVLTQISGIAGLAAASGIQVGKPPYEAVRNLEAARCVTSGLLMNVKDDIPELRLAYPELYQKYNNLRQSYHIGPQPSNSSFPALSRNLTQVNEDLTSVENEIRTKVGFENFQLPPSEDELIKLAVDGPIVVFNVTRFRSDAIIVTSEALMVLNLPKLGYVELETKIKTLGSLSFDSRQRNAVPRRSAKTKGNIKSVLQWLWDVAIQPVLENTPLTSSKRIWWMTNGLMSLAPLHAAGNHEKGSKENTLSYVVSSYVSSFKALSYARKVRRRDVGESRALLATMADTPGQQRLNVETEKQVLTDHFGPQLTIKEQPTGAEVLSLLSSYSIIHLACHGYFSKVAPSDSGLVFAKGSEQDVLPISSIERVSTSNAELAYLSACSTAELSVGGHLDEAINLANCFQTLGFRHVIGTLWSASDHSAGVVATKFYKNIAEQMSSPNKRLDAASALHNAVKEYAQECSGDDGPLHWGPYIHIGI